MKISGIQKLTLVDFPGRVAATIFTQGCSFHCPFCHNPELVLPEKFEPCLDEGQVFDFFEKRYGKLTGICITGGEPLLQKDIGQFIAHIKALGFDVKLDTNGSFPDRLKEMIDLGDLDYIAMDIKSSLAKYALTTQVKSQNNTVISTFLEPTGGRIERNEKSHHNGTADLNEKIKKSIKLIMESGIKYEFRTTICHPLHEVKDFEEIGKMIRGADKYYLQNFVHSKHVDESTGFQPFSDFELKESLKIMKKYVKNSFIR
ncbi:MAG: anaerobic ribonucleoside-triphosphate reductase activating protein [Candidatus Berkelbacteria bacterium]|nr:anaerobic ribonucleoside-triphosphate reductase activating protein [Candidatus Berkelbacteria bacterium]